MFYWALVEERETRIYLEDLSWVEQNQVAGDFNPRNFLIIES